MPDIMMDLLGSMLPAPEYATKEYVQARIAEAMNTAGSGPSVVLEHATFTANGSYQPDPGKAWDEVVVNVQAGGGNLLESDFMTVYKETVEVGENTVSNSAQYQTYLYSIKSIPGTLIAMSIHKKVSYTYNEWANGHGTVSNNNGYRYRGTWQYSSWNNPGYDAVAPAGTLVDVYTVELKNPNNA